MIFNETPLKGAYVISIEKLEETRGFFARAWCRKEFNAYGLTSDFVQANIAYNHKKGTLRGMRYQMAPYEEVKLVRCMRGGIYDVIIDLRPHSLTYMQWAGIELTAESRDSIYVPAGFAHGYQVLEDCTDVFYEVTQFHRPESERGIQYDDEAFGVLWPMAVTDIAEKDKCWPAFAPQKRSTS